MNHISFEGRVVVVTGARRGLGRAYALEFGRRGASVVVNDYAGEHADHVVAEIEEAGGTGIAAYDSIETQSGAAAVVATALDHFGTVDAVVNNAGFMRNGFVEQQTPESFSVVINVHVAGTFFVTQAAWPTFKEKGYG
jgi:NAD(P)-dependent dehydrogenase (short-subunit alcohol dehydrogenase family)